MEAKEPTTFNNLPERVDFLISEVAGIKQILLQGIAKPEEVPKYLDITQVLFYLKKRGVLVSRSKLYKMTSEDSIPHRKMSSKLYFLPNEIDMWLASQIEVREEMSQQLLSKSSQSIIKSAQNKNKKNNGK